MLGLGNSIASSGSTGFAPSDISGLVANFNFLQGVTISSDEVTNWADTTSPRWVTRLTTGDKVMFTGLEAGDLTQDDDSHTKFNVHIPHTVNMVDVNKFIIK